MGNGSTTGSTPGRHVPGSAYPVATIPGGILPPDDDDDRVLGATDVPEPEAHEPPVSDTDSDDDLALSPESRDALAEIARKLAEARVLKTVEEPAVSGELVNRVVEALTPTIQRAQFDMADTAAKEAGGIAAERGREAMVAAQEGLKTSLEQALQDAKDENRRKARPWYIGFVAAVAIAIGIVGWVYWQDMSYQNHLDRIAQGEGHESYEAVLEEVGYASEAEAKVMMPIHVKEALDRSNEAYEAAHTRLDEELSENEALKSDLEEASDRAGAAAADAAAAADSASSAEESASSAQRAASRAGRKAQRAEAAADSLASEQARSSAGFTIMVNNNLCDMVDIKTLGSGATRNQFACGSTDPVFLLCKGSEPPEAEGCYVE